MPRLLVHAVTNRTLASYVRAVLRFLRFVSLEQEPVETIEQLDDAMTWHMDHMAYEQKQSSQAGKNLKSGAVHLLPDLKDQLPKASRAVRSWEKLEGEVEREPLCLALSGIVVEKLGKKSPLYGWAAFSQLRDLLR